MKGGFERGTTPYADSEHQNTGATQNISSNKHIGKMSSPDDFSLRYFALDYAKLKGFLATQGENTNEIVVTILNALRQRLLGPDMITRKQTLHTFMFVDAFDISKPIVKDQIAEHQPIYQKLLTNSELLLPSLRLFSVMACDSVGRSYLCHNNDFLKLLLSFLKPKVIEKVHENERVAVGNRCLAILQNLSLRKVAQNTMIQENLIEKILQKLENYETLSIFGLDYYSALLMNLCLRYEGRERFDKAGEKALGIVRSLLNTGGGNVRTFINGVLFSVLKGKKPGVDPGVTEIIEFLKDLRSNGPTNG